jgi:hypothetical protein
MSTLSSQQTAADAVAAVFRLLGHLPGAAMQIDTIIPERVDISLHDDLGDFEAWREALGIPPSAVTVRKSSSYFYLKAEGEFAGARVELVGFGPTLTFPDERGAA